MSNLSSHSNLIKPFQKIMNDEKISHFNVRFIRLIKFVFSISLNKKYKFHTYISNLSGCLSEPFPQSVNMKFEFHTLMSNISSQWYLLILLTQYLNKVKMNLALSCEIY